MITAIEKQLVLDNYDNYFITTEGKALFKVLYNFVNNKIGKRSSNDIDNEIMNDEEVFNKISRKLIEDIISNAEDVVPVVTYSTTEIAETFGVSVQTVHNWVENGKLSGVEKVEGKHLRIPETAIFIGNKGKSFSIKEKFQEYNAMIEESNVTISEEIKILEETIQFFVNKYGSISELQNKIDKSDFEIRDLNEWVYLLDRLSQAVKGIQLDD